MGDSRAEGSSATGDGGQAAVSLTPDADGTDSGSLLGSNQSSPLLLLDIMGLMMHDCIQYCTLKSTKPQPPVEHARTGQCMLDTRTHLLDLTRLDVETRLPL